MDTFSQEKGLVTKHDVNNLTVNKFASVMNLAAETSIDITNLKPVSFKQIQSRLTQREVDDLCNKLLSRPGVFDYVDEKTKENFAYLEKTGILKKDTGAIKPYSQFGMDIYTDKSGKPTYLTIALNSDWAVDKDFMIRAGNINVKDLEALEADLKTYAFLKDNANANNVGAIQELYDKINERIQVVSKQNGDVVTGIAGKSMMSVMNWYTIDYLNDKVIPIWKSMKDPFGVMLIEADFMAIDASHYINRIMHVENNIIYQDKRFTEAFPIKMHLAFAVQKGLFGYKFSADGRDF